MSQEFEGDSTALLNLSKEHFENLTSITLSVNTDPLEGVEWDTLSLPSGLLILKITSYAQPIRITTLLPQRLEALEICAPRTMISFLPSSLRILKCQKWLEVDFRTLPPGLKHLDCTSCDLTSLDGIEVLKELVTLACDDNNIARVTHLPPLLESFSCSFNRIEAIDYLPSMLVSLTTTFNKNLKVLPNLPYGLKELCVDGWISPRPRLPKSLVWLSVRYNNSMAEKAKDSLYAVRGHGQKVCTQALAHQLTRDIKEWRAGRDLLLCLLKRNLFNLLVRVKKSRKV